MNLNKLIRKITGRSDIVDNGTTYMKRWRFIHTKAFGVRIHKIERSDQDRELHDHPFSFVSIILKGGYIEETVDGRKTFYGPGSILFRSADTLHRLDLVKTVPGVNGTETPAWTFVIRGPERRQWGFLTPAGWIPAYLWHKHVEAVKHRRMQEVQ